MHRIVLHDGTYLEAKWAGVSGDILCLSVKTRDTVLQLASLFSDVSKTDKIWFEFGENTETYEGYTNLVSVTTMISEALIQLRHG